MSTHIPSCCCATRLAFANRQHCPSHVASGGRHLSIPNRYLNVRVAAISCAWTHLKPRCEANLQPQPNPSSKHKTILDNGTADNRQPILTRDPKLTPDHIVSHHRKPVRQPRQCHICVCVVANPASTSTITDQPTDRSPGKEKGDMKMKSWRNSNNHLRLSSTTYVVRRPTTFSIASTNGYQKGSFVFSLFAKVKDYKGLHYVSFYQTLSTILEDSDFLSTTSTRKITGSSLKSLHPSQIYPPRRLYFANTDQQSLTLKRPKTYSLFLTKRFSIPQTVRTKQLQKS